MNQNQNKKLEQLQYILRDAHKSLATAQKLVIELTGKPLVLEGGKVDEEYFKVDRYPTGEEVVEGVFNGKDMQGPDNQIYPIPENYASKSKLVEGDRLKLTITPQGRFIYKQIGPVDRETKRGIVLYHEDRDQFVISADGKEYKVIKASVSYFKGAPGDEAVILVLRDYDCVWAALDTIIKELPSGGLQQEEHEVKPAPRKKTQLEEI